MFLLEAFFLVVSFSIPRTDVLLLLLSHVSRVQLCATP